MRSARFLTLLVMLICCVYAPASASTSYKASSSATYEGSDNCPVSENGDGGFVTDATATLLLNDYTTIPVKVEGAQDIHVVCTSTSYPVQSEKDITVNGDVLYRSFLGPKDTESFVVGATDGVKYFSTTVTVNLERIVFQTPVVTRKMVVKNNRPQNAGQVSIANNTTRPMFIKAGVNPNRPDVVKDIPPGGRQTVTSWRKILVLTMFTKNDEAWEVYVTSARVNMVTGKVTMFLEKEFVRGR